MLVLCVVASAVASWAIGWSFGGPKKVREDLHLIDEPDHAFFNALLVSTLMALFFNPLVLLSVLIGFQAEGGAGFMIFALAVALFGFQPLYLLPALVCVVIFCTLGFAGRRKKVT